MRKKPVQKRSRSVVEALIEAAGQVLVEEGLDTMTTVKVAERAGVSVGSLYQYFGSKDDLLRALVDQLDGDMTSAVDQVASRGLALNPERFARALLDVAFAVLEAREGLGHELLRHWHRLEISQGLYRFEQRMLEVLRVYALAHLRDYQVDPSPARSFIIINSVVFTLLRYLGEQDRQVFSRDELAEELARMAAQLLTPKRKRKKRT